MAVIVFWAMRLLEKTGHSLLAIQFNVPFNAD